MYFYAASAFIQIAIWTWLWKSRQDETSQVALFRGALVVQIATVCVSWASLPVLGPTAAYMAVLFACTLAANGSLALVVIVVIRQLRPFPPWVYAAAGLVVLSLAATWSHA